MKGDRQVTLAVILQHEGAGWVGSRAVLLLQIQTET